MLGVHITFAYTLFLPSGSYLVAVGSLASVGLVCSVVQSKREAQPTCFAEAIAAASSWELAAGNVTPVVALCVAIATMMSQCFSNQPLTQPPDGSGA